jgi:hypothetical protein
MKNCALIFVHAGCALVLLLGAYSNPVKSKLQGKWSSKDGSTKLSITGKAFIMENEGSANKLKSGRRKGDPYDIKIFCAFQGGLHGVYLKNHGNRYLMSCFFHG